jgi:hypothetical protein
MELLLPLILLHGGSVYADDVPHSRHHWEIVQALGIDDHRTKGWRLTLVVVGMIDDLYCANELSLRVLVWVARIYYHAEEVVVVMLLRSIEA